LCIIFAQAPDAAFDGAQGPDGSLRRQAAGWRMRRRGQLAAPECDARCAVKGTSNIAVGGVESAVGERHLARHVPSRRSP